MEGGWRPIESAPKDGTAIIIGGGDLERPAVVWWAVRNYWAGLPWPDEQFPYRFTHWMPIPAPPA